ncbi:MAG: hypothetical protein ABSB15_11210 [Bryobacteraceae bacterium]|jgi:hypothetical protein
MSHDLQVSEALRYPIGQFQFPQSVSSEERLQHIQTIAGAPKRLRNAVSGHIAHIRALRRRDGW